MAMFPVELYRCYEGDCAGKKFPGPVSLRMHIERKHAPRPDQEDIESGRFIPTEQAQQNIKRMVQEASEIKYSSLRAEVLGEASKAVLGERHQAYGQPEDNFGHIAGLLNAMGYVRRGKPQGIDPRDGEMIYEEEDLNATDVAIILACLKLGRIKTNRTHKDSWVDLAGYAACGYQAAQATEGTDVNDRS